ncbi:hypothetical protein C8F04DRAFT_1186611 [Mycena alexandri]|uniref:Uncharacterized protein n=1 Tax=Mycena alexandri TaxID=1745969 RepID=A0AAD6SMP6_9AGAR|nr:hypothetical protein C8F04DRAFT_1186611 [Mycena alexandri]
MSTTVTHYDDPPLGKLLPAHPPAAADASVLMAVMYSQILSPGIIISISTRDGWGAVNYMDAIRDAIYNICHGFSLSLSAPHCQREYHNRECSSAPQIFETCPEHRLSYEGLRKDYADDVELLRGLDLSKTRLQTHYNIYYASMQSSVSEEAEEVPGSPVKFNLFGMGRVHLPVPPRMSWKSTSEPLVSQSHLRIQIHLLGGGRDTIGIQRASLRAETVEMLMFVKARLRLAREASKKAEKALVELL